jgi:hypothetical protein
MFKNQPFLNANKFLKDFPPIFCNVIPWHVQPNNTIMMKKEGELIY